MLGLHKLHLTTYHAGDTFNIFASVKNWPWLRTWRFICFIFCHSFTFKNYAHFPFSVRKLAAEIFERRSSRNTLKRQWAWSVRKERGSSE